MKQERDHIEDGGESVQVGPTMPDPELERRLVRKLDMTILPWIMLLYLLSYLDRYLYLHILTRSQQLIMSVEVTSEMHAISV
jgi:hypothetical protein